jgi:hypothetical protein
MFCNIWFSSVIADTLQEIKVAHINVGLVYGAYVASNGRFFGFLLSTGLKGCYLKNEIFFESRNC